MSICIQLNKLHNKELQDMCALPNFTTLIKDEEGGNAARFEEK
jgi:hypothetical protein